MKKSRSASKKRSAKKKPAKKRTASAKRKIPKKTKKTRSGAVKRGAGAKKRATAKKAGRKPAKKASRAAARPRRASVAKKPKARVAAPRVRRAPKPVAAPAPAPTVPANELKAGVVTHYYSHLSVAVVAVTERRLQVGNRIHIKGHTSDFYQTVESMQIEHDTIGVAEIGQTVGLKVTEHAREHDVVYLVT
jgi:putative protease